MAMSEDTFDVAQGESLVAFSGPAPIANRIIISPYPTGLRIAFLEQQNTGEAHFRSAVFLSTDSAVALRRLLDHMLSKE
jgi:hypothetical protein